MSHSDIAKASGLPKTTVSELSFRTDWSGIAIGVADRFARACGVNLMTPSKSIRRLRRLKMVHIVKAKGNQRRLYHQILQFLKSKRKQAQR
jgi:hypothetical protein